MSQANVELVRSLIEAYNAGGIGSPAALAYFDSEAVFEEPPEQPGASVAHGRAAVGEVFGRFDAAWDDHRTEIEEVRAIDADRVLLLSVDHFRGRDGIELVNSAGTVFTIRGDKVVRMQAFWERESAFRVANGPEPS